MKLAVAQINCTVGDLAGNAKKILNFTNQAKNKGASLVVTPELALSGYPPEDLFLAWLVKLRIFLALPAKSMAWFNASAA